MSLIIPALLVVCGEINILSVPLDGKAGTGCVTVTVFVVRNS